MCVSVALAVGASSEIGDLGRSRVERFGGEQSGTFKESVVLSNIEVRVKRAGPSGLGDLEVTEYIARIRNRSRERTEQDSCLTNSSLQCFIAPLTC